MLVEDLHKSIQILVKIRIKEQYIKGYFNKEDYDYRIDENGNFIRNLRLEESFTWGDTSEGHDFWHDINNGKTGTLNHIERKTLKMNFKY
jgi:hypothetical protein